MAPGGGLRVTVAVIAFAIVAGLAGVASAQQPPPVLVKEIVVEEGQSVSEGDTLVVLE